MNQADQINLRLLLEGCLQENMLSQRKLYEHYFGYGMSICLRYAAHRNEASEILNDAFVKIFANLDKYDSEFPFKSWIRRIIINQAIDHLRRNKHNWFFEDIADVANRVIPHQINQDDSDPARVLKILQILPPKYRTVFNLYVIEEYKHHEIAEMLDISASTSRSNLARAKEKLKRALSKKNVDMNKAQ